MSEKIQQLVDRRDRAQSDLMDLISLDIAFVLRGEACQFSDNVDRLAHEINILDAAIEQIRSAA